MGIPALSLILVAVIWFRGAEIRVFFVIVAIALPIMVLNTLDGIKGIPRELTEMLISFRPTLWQRVHMITLPGAMPSIIVGMKIALSFATRLAVFAELIGTTQGFGSALYSAFQTFNLTAVFVWTILLVVLLYALNGLLLLLERWLLRYRVPAPA
jgi:ABC-type nitrate/sulfonate/bicarbonate transport system permease component